MKTGFISIKVRKDNLMYLFYNEEYAFCVDPFSPKTILHAAGCDFDRQCYSEDEVLSLEKTRNRRILYALTTHGHYDHNGGNEELKGLCPDVTFIEYGSLMNNPMSQDHKAVDTLIMNNSMSQDHRIVDTLMDPFSILPIYTPCHTLDSYCYAISADDGETYKYVLTGDFIFKLGCGRFFEGDSMMFYDSLSTLINILDDNCMMLYGHDYYETNRRFTEQFYKVEGCDEFFLSLREEKKYNIFFRMALGDEEVMRMVEKYSGTSGDIYKHIGILRKMKDAFQ